MKTVAKKTCSTGLVVMVLFTLAYVTFMFSPAPAYAWDPGQQVNIEQTATNVYDAIQKPLLAVCAIALVIGSIVFITARGNPEKARQARVGLAAAVGGFIIGVGAVGILNLAKGLVA
jgi:membrane associated rhomboid family serine protease